jgi:hypothetical protein
MTCFRVRAPPSYVIEGKGMFHRPDIAISCAPDLLSVVVRSVTLAGRERYKLIEVPIPSDSIDPLSGKLIREEGVRTALKRLLRQVVRKGTSVRYVALLVPSSAAYLHSWVEQGDPRQYSHEELARRVEVIFPGRGEGLVFDFYQAQCEGRASTRVMLAAISRDVIQSYVCLLGALRAHLVLSTTGELARFNSCCALLPSVRRRSAVICAARGRYLEVTSWCDGVVRFSKKVRLVGEYSTISAEPGSLIDSTGQYRLGEGVVHAQVCHHVSEAFSCFAQRELEDCQIVACGSQSGRITQTILAAVGALRGGAPKVAIKIPEAWAGFEDALGALLTIKPPRIANLSRAIRLRGASQRVGSEALGDVIRVSDMQNIVEV